MDFKFIDLFAGIGGFHLALHKLGGECVFASEMDLQARKTYEHNFSKISPNLFKEGMFNDDIRNIAPEDIPNFDVLCAGFPCQPFSQAGHKRGFDDNHKSERGNLFFNIAEIIEVKRPKAIFLENVRGLVKHDNGNTIRVIRDIIELDLGYSFYLKVVKATDYGLPQHRPRAFMIGFRDEGFLRGFTFPEPTPLKFDMSHVWGGECSRDIGFTLRVGGRGSTINDRRNWDAYLVDGKVRRLGSKEGLMMQGFPHDFEFPVSPTQAMKQLGNSVAVDAVQAVAEQMLRHMHSLSKEQNTMVATKNKGEWTELFVFMKLLSEQRLYLSDESLNKVSNYFNIHKVTNQHLPLEFAIVDQQWIRVIDKFDGNEKAVDIRSILSSQVLASIVEEIKGGSGTFVVTRFTPIQDQLGFSMVKGGHSNQKSDILLDVSNDDVTLLSEGFGIKSYLGSKPTLLNASGNTNFIFEVKGINVEAIDDINSIRTKKKLVDRLTAIELMGGELIFKGAERSSMDYNLSLVDSHMPEIIGHILVAFFKNRIAKINEIVDFIHNEGSLQERIGYMDKDSLTVKVKRLLLDVLLGLFPGKKWDGEYDANGIVIVKTDGDMVGFHVVDKKTLKEYLFESIKLDTPSTTRHRYGTLYVEKNGRLYFKLNLQLRF